MSDDYMFGTRYMLETKPQHGFITSSMFVLILISTVFNTVLPAPSQHTSEVWRSRTVRIESASQGCFWPIKLNESRDGMVNQVYVGWGDDWMGSWVVVGCAVSALWERAILMDFVHFDIESSDF